MKFYDRESEQHLLKEVLRQSKREARMTVLMGRRRIGKTQLSLRCGDDTVLYFFVGKKAEALLCQDFIQEITTKLGVPPRFRKCLGLSFNFPRQGSLR